jgi:putative peptidoglycan lipid II flippase
VYGARDPDRDLTLPVLAIMAGTLTASLLGFARAWVVARQFGAGQSTDSFFAALAIPQTLYDNLIGVAIVAILIPTFARVAASGSSRAVAPLALSTVALLLIPLGTTLIVFELAARPLFLSFASGFALHSHAGAGQQGVEMLRLLLPSLLLLGTSAVLMGALYALRHGFLATVSRAGIHVGIILAALAVSARGGVDSLAIGAVIGCGLQVLFLAFFLLRATQAFDTRAGRGVPAAWTSQNPGRPVSLGTPRSARPTEGAWPYQRLKAGLARVPVRRMGALYLPVAAGGLIAIAGVVADLNFKSHLPQSGGLSSMQYATQLVQFPLGILAMGLGAAVLPRLSVHHARGDRLGFSTTMGGGLRLVLILSLPVMVLLLVLAGPITTAVFEHGRFGSEAATNTARALTGYAPQLPLVGILQVLLAACYARHDTLRPSIVGILGTCVYVPLAWVLIAPLTVIGLALANTVQFGVQVLILLALVARSEAGALTAGQVAPAALKAILACAFMAAGLLALLRWVPMSFQGVGGGLRLAGLLAVGAGVYGALGLLLGIEEFSMTGHSVRRLVTRVRTARYSAPRPEAICR